MQQLYDADGEAHWIPRAAASTSPRARVSCCAVRSTPGSAEIHLGWKPFTTLEEGLSRTLEHFKALRTGAS